MTSTNYILNSKRTFFLKGTCMCKNTIASTKVQEAIVFLHMHVPFKKNVLCTRSNTQIYAISIHTLNQKELFYGRNERAGNFYGAVCKDYISYISFCICAFLNFGLWTLDC